MEIMIRMKSAGKRRDILAPTPYTLPDGIRSLRELLTELVKQETERYNRKEPGAQMIPFLTQQELEDQIKTGKVGFGSIYSDQKADPRKATENALQCWRDGLVRVFLNGTELTDLDAPLELSAGSELTLIRLTFLTGSIW